MSQSPAFQRVAILGVGLIGGSLARDLRASGSVGEVVGIEPDPATLDRARQRGLIDRGETDPESGVRDADVVVVAVPVGSFGEALAAIRPGLSEGVVVTDVGSVKGPVQAEAEEALAGAAAFVGGHPIAGTEDSGVDAAVPDLFRDALCVLTRTGTTPEWAVTRIRRLWEGVGGEVVCMDPEEHDRILAATSHLPHMLAFALIRTFAGLSAGPGVERFAAGGFRDLTRIAGSDAIMWRDIALANAPALLATIDRFQERLRELRYAIEAGDGETLEGLLREARELRRGLAGDADESGTGNDRGS